MTESYVNSWYASTAHATPPRPALQERLSTDICIIGAGFTGLSTALHLAELGYQVVVLEAAKVGWGASGRNGGQIVNGYSRDLSVIQKRYGTEAATALGGMSLEGGHIIRQFIKQYHIDCDFHPGNVIAALNARQLNELNVMYHNWQEHGHQDLVMLDAEDLREHVNSLTYIGGLYDRLGGHVHPLNLCLGEAAAVESLGGRIFEHSALTHLDRSAKKPVVKTAHGEVHADYVVLCGNAYLGEAVPELQDQVMPVSTQIVTTEVLGESLCRELMRKQTCVEDANYMLDYYRMTADHRLLYGGGTVYGGAEPADIEAKIRPHLEKTFPMLRDVPLEFAWSGNFALTLTRIPQFGQLGEKVYFAHGYSGHGVTATHLAGKLVSEAIHGDASRFQHFSQLPYYTFPGGRRWRVPLTMAGAWWYQLRDKWGI